MNTVEKLGMNFATWLSSIFYQDLDPGILGPKALGVTVQQALSGHLNQFLDEIVDDFDRAVCELVSTLGQEQFLEFDRVLHEMPEHTVSCLYGKVSNQKCAVIRLTTALKISDFEKCWGSDCSRFELCLRFDCNEKKKGGRFDKNNPVYFHLCKYHRGKIKINPTSSKEKEETLAVAIHRKINGSIPLKNLYQLLRHKGATIKGISEKMTCREALLVGEDVLFDLFPGEANTDIQLAILEILEEQREELENTIEEKTDSAAKEDKPLIACDNEQEVESQAHNRSQGNCQADESIIEVVKRELTDEDEDLVFQLANLLEMRLQNREATVKEVAEASDIFFKGQWPSSKPQWQQIKEVIQTVTQPFKKEIRELEDNEESDKEGEKAMPRARQFAPNELLSEAAATFARNPSFTARIIEKRLGEHHLGGLKVCEAAERWQELVKVFPIATRSRQTLAMIATVIFNKAELITYNKLKELVVQAVPASPSAAGSEKTTSVVKSARKKYRQDVPLATEVAKYSYANIAKTIRDAWGKSSEITVGGFKKLDKEARESLLELLSNSVRAKVEAIAVDKEIPKKKEKKKSKVKKTASRKHGRRKAAKPAAAEPLATTEAAEPTEGQSLSDAAAELSQLRVWLSEKSSQIISLAQKASGVGIEIAGLMELGVEVEEAAGKITKISQRLDAITQQIKQNTEKTVEAIGGQ